jgi:hypothetical protein
MGLEEYCSSYNWYMIENLEKFRKVLRIIVSNNMNDISYLKQFINSTEYFSESYHEIENTNKILTNFYKIDGSYTTKYIESLITRVTG